VTFSRPRDLPVIAPALLNAGFLEAAPDSMIQSTLIKGRPGTPMVSFLEQGLSEADIADLVSHVRSFEAKLEAEGTHPAEPDEAPAMMLTSPYSLEETVENVKQAAIGKNFRIIREQYFDEGLVAEGKERRDTIIVYFCNFEMLNEGLAIDPRVGLFLPCRVTVRERQGEVQVLAINPKTLAHLFNNEELVRICDELAGLYRSILEEATL
jgi:cytochrome c oxidase cbb3-type subunit 3